MTEEARMCIEALRGIERMLIRSGGIAEENMAKGVARAVDLIESLSAQLEQVTRERDAAVNQLVSLEYPIPCDSDELDGSEYCEENCHFKTPQKECWVRYFNECGVEVEGWKLDQ